MFGSFFYRSIYLCLKLPHAFNMIFDTKLPFENLYGLPHVACFNIDMAHSKPAQENRKNNFDSKNYTNMFLFDELIRDCRIYFPASM